MAEFTSDAPVTVVMTDLEGSTALHTRRGDNAARELIRQHEAIVRSALADHGGNEVKALGDGFLACFTSTRRALDCAIDIQRRCDSADGLRVRVGLHAGEVIHEDGDIFGAAVAAVGRIMARAAGGEILVSDLVRQLAGAAGVRFTARMPVQLKGLDGMWLLHDVAWRADGADELSPPLPAQNESIDGLPISRREAEVLAVLRERLTNAEIAARLFISVRTVESHVSTLLRKLGASDRRELARRAATSQEVRHAGGGIPVALTSFVGRHDERELVAKRLREGRLVTLKGPGGVGKTRLAIEMASEASRGGDTDVAFADLTAAGDGGDVLRVVATAVGVTDEPGRTLADSVLSRLGGAHTLLVLDNCEQILDDVAELVGWMLAATSEVRVLITSREPLDLPGEVVVSLAPLGVPESADASALAVASSDAGRLFVDRASAVDGAFVLTDVNAAAVASICRRLDGIPLALELAAGQADLLDPAQIDALLGQSFAVLRGSGRGRPAHHETLEAMLAASFDRLDATARATMNRLGVFRGTFTLDAVQAVVADDDITAAAVLDAVRALVRKSLIVVVEGAGERRYRLLETVREYAWRGVVAAGDSALARQRHFDWAMDLASRAGEGLTGASQVQWLNGLDYDLDNLEAAFEWSLDNPGRAGRAMDAVSALSNYWMARGTHRVPGTRWAEATATAATEVDQATRTQALMNGILLVMWSDVGAAMSLLAVAQRVAAGDARAEAYATVAASCIGVLRGERIDLPALELAADALVDDEMTCVWARAALAWGHSLHGDNVRAHELMMSGVCQRLGELGDEHLRGAFLSVAADLALASGDADAAFAEASESLDLALTPACASCESQAQMSLALLGAAGDGPARVKRARRGLGLAAEIAETVNVLAGLEVLSGTLALTGDFETAITLAAAAAALEGASGFGSLPARAALSQRGIDLAHSSVDQATFDALWAAGAALGYEHAVELALTGD